MAKMTIQERIERSIQRSTTTVFIRADFDKFGGYDQVGRVLREIVKSGILVKVGYGVYVKARKSVVTGNFVPVIPLLEVGLQALARLGVKADLGAAAQEYMQGNTTQMPMATVVNVGKSRISRQLGFGSKMIRYEK